VLKRIIKLLITDLVVNIIQISILVEKILVLPPCEHFEISRLRSIDILCLQSEISEVFFLKHNLRSDFQGKISPAPKVQVKGLHGIIVGRLHV
jgi:hypothetical protein